MSEGTPGKQPSIPMELKTPPKKTRERDEFAWLLEQSHLADVTIVTDHGITFPAHKVILESRSEYFRAMLRTPMQESSSDAIQLPHLRPDLFKSVLEQLYTGVTSITECNVQDLLETADMLRVTGLQRQCEDFMGTLLSAENVLDAHTLAIATNSKVLQEKCVEKAVEMIENVAPQENFHTHGALEEVHKFVTFAVTFVTVALEVRLNVK